MRDTIFTADFKPQPYWWDSTPRPVVQAEPLPTSTEVLIIGSGYTGLNCAIQTARAGRATLVIDAQSAGWGCSSRNGGQISGEIKPGYSKLKKQYGAQRAFDTIREAREALDWVAEFIRAEKIDCEFRACGRFEAAHSARQFNAMVKAATSQPTGLEQSLTLIERKNQASEIDSEYYHGGRVIGHHCAIDPAKFHQGLLQSALTSGARVVSDCAALHIEKTSNGFRVTTKLGVVEASKVVVATNGYTGAVTPWQRRRVIPIGSYMLATEPLEQARIAKLMPGNRVYSDSRRVVVYFRRSPDSRRVIFGGRVSVFETDPVKSAGALRQEMLRIFPQIEDAKLSHSWMGLVGFSFDYLPHLGQQDGLYYAMGYCGSGICLASYLGNRLGLQLLGRAEGKTSFDDYRFQTRPLYSGKPWFLGAAVRYYQMLDSLS